MNQVDILNKIMLCNVISSKVISLVKLKSVECFTMKLLGKKFMVHEVRTSVSVKLSVKTPEQTNVTSIWSDRIFVAHVFWPSYKTSDYLSSNDG